MQSTFAKVLFKQNIGKNNSSGLRWAVQHDRRDIANIFLSYDANVNAIENGEPLLWCAVRCQAMDTIGLLLNHHNIDINGCDDQGRSILWYAIYINSDEVIIRYILDQIGYDHCCRPTVAPRSFDLAILRFAITKGAECVAKRLLQQEVEPDGKHEDARCFFLAVTNDSASIAQMFLRRGVDINAVDVDENQSTALHHAARLGNTVMMGFLLQQRGVSVNSRDSRQNTPLHVAIQYGKHACIDILLCVPEVDIDAQDFHGRTPFWWVTFVQSDRWFGRLLDRNVNYNMPDHRGRAPLHNLAKFGKSSPIRLLLNQVDVELNAVDLDGYTPLARSVQHAHLPVAQLLLAQPKIRVNAESGHEVTPLWVACRSGRKDMVRLLLGHKYIDVNQVNASGATSLHVSVIFGHLDVLSLLLRQGEKLDVSVRDEWGWTPLMHAVSRNQAQMVNLLLEVQGTDINAVDGDGRTAFWWAAAGGHHEIVQILRSNSKTRLKDNFGKTAYDAARERGNGAVLCFLRPP
ncbi:ankyrin repeat domain-containing protein [Aspergillus melleus]|uniref:ankyrin repeat domain-containing protein n=1 Tax=Aspergillus melleus TaxID=138277 RepID=UPI001E8CCDF8|nr:uncharacterized protein LDX57_007732 [Aspergillus melleus]KAH8430061.1 hypothetical protein LDX57_007732 [Aspergillus melleus]